MVNSLGGGGRLKNAEENDNNLSNNVIKNSILKIWLIAVFFFHIFIIAIFWFFGGFHVFY